jgi:hypothetical protein
MLDVHPPEHTPHTWRDFFIHIATIVLGLLIAIGLEQSVEYLHHRHQVTETREALLHERTENRRNSSDNVRFLLRMQATLRNNLQVLNALNGHSGIAANSLPGVVFCESDWALPAEAAWKAAQQSGVVNYMPQGEVRENEALYAMLKGSADKAGVTVIALYKACQYLNLDPDPTHLSQAQVQETLKQMIATETEERGWEDWLRDQHSLFPDFEGLPAPEQTSIARPLDPQEEAALAKATQLTKQRIDAAAARPDPVLHIQKN